jgi:hypothetical protein
LNVRVALEVLNMTGSMYAFLIDSNGAASPRAGAIFGGVSGRNNITFAPPTNFFTPDIQAEPSYVEMGPTSLSGTNGMSYYDLTINIPARASGSNFTEQKYQNESVTVMLNFQGGVDQTAGISETVNPISPALAVGNRALNTNSNFAKNTNQRNPGKFHRVCKFDYPGTTRLESWHHVMMLRPGDATIAPYSNLNPEQFILWPAIPADVVPTSLVGGAGENAGASPGTGLQNGDTFTIYPCTQFNVYSVTIEESY